MPNAETPTIPDKARAHTTDLGEYVVASPSSYHAAAEGARRLEMAGFRKQAEQDAWDGQPGGHYLVRDGALVAWWIPKQIGKTAPYRVVGSHTDGTGFKLKPGPTTESAGWVQVGLEVYGGPLLNSWLDRELGLAGRLVDRDGAVTLVRTGPVMRIPQLAIHLDRGVNDNGLTLDKQRHTQPIWAVGSRADHDVLGHLAQVAGVAADQVDGYDVVAFDTAAPAYFGAAQEFFASTRLDNLSSVHASLTALIEAAADGRLDGESISVVAAFDHEEIGSETRSGACGPLLQDVLTRISAALDGSADDFGRAVASSFCLSADAGHAVHPNYAERHDPVNRPIVNAGPLLKINANQRYATDAVGAAMWHRACRDAGVPTQEFVSNNTVPCGSTIGPLTATRLGLTTVDVGVPLLSMHSAREMCGTADPYYLSRAVCSFFAGA